MTKGEAFHHVTVASGLAEAILLSSKTSNNAIVFPLYLYPDDGDDQMDVGSERRPNFTDGFMQTVGDTLGVCVADGRGEDAGSIGADDLLDYIVAILHSPSYRRRYAALLTRDFPRIPVIKSLDAFRALARVGGEIVELHLMTSTKLDRPVATYVGAPDPRVEKVSYAQGTIWLDEAQSCGFRSVLEAVWNFHLGGYQVCEKWLKDRGPKKGQPGRVLTADDIAHYVRIVTALHETIQIQLEIDEVIEGHGGWPDAFSGP